LIPPIVQFNVSDTSSYSGTSTSYSLVGGTNGTLVNSPVSGDTGCGTYLNFDGVNQYILTTSDIQSYFTGSSPNKSEITSITMWVYPTGDGVILSELGVSSIASGWHDSQIEMVSGTLKFGMWNGSGISSITSSISTPLNNWYHISMTYDGSTLNAYVNGSNAGTITFNRSAPYNNGVGLFYGIGLSDTTNMGDGTYGNFRLGAFKVYDKSLTPTQVYNDYVNTQSNFICPYRYTSATTLSWPSSTSGYTLYSGGFTNSDDGYSTSPITLPTTFKTNNVSSTSLYISTNGYFTIGSGSGSILSSPSQASPASMCANPSDNWLQPGLVMTDGDTQNAYYQTGTDGFGRYYVKLLVYGGTYQATTTPKSWIANFYRDNTYQWLEVRAKSNVVGQSGPYNVTSVSQPSSTTSRVWRGDLNGQNWVYLGTGSITT